MRLNGPLWVFRAAAGVFGVVAAAAAGLAYSASPGDIDPVSAGVGLVSAALAYAAYRQAQIAQRLAERDIEVWAPRLANAVLAQESGHRTQLLGADGAVIDLDFVFRPLPGAAPIVAGPEGSLERVVGYFRGLNAPQRLVITGAAGSGKTVLAVQLIIGLLSDRRPGEPIPVRISTASWDTRTPVSDWLTGHLVAGFALPPASARALVEAGQILPVIDGLDEMDADAEPSYASRAGQALHVLNAYQVGAERTRLVLTCRTGQYDALQTAQVWAKGAARVDLSPVSSEKTWRFLRKVTDQDDPRRWQPVLDALTKPGHVLATALNTPWRLTLAAAVYEERDSSTGSYLRDPADLAAIAGESELREHLLARFIPARLATVPAAMAC